MIIIGELKTDSKNSSEVLREFEEVKKNSQIYLRRFKKEKRYRRKLQEQLEVETQRRVQMEEALRNMTSGAMTSMTSSEALKRITESLTLQNQTSESKNCEGDLKQRSSSPLEGSNDKDRRESGDDARSSPASSSASNVALAAAAAAAAAAQFNATVSTSEASSDRGTPPRGKK